MNKGIIGIIMLALSVVLLGCHNDKDSAQNEAEASAVDIFISAAASMTEVMDELKKIYEMNHNVNIIFNFAGSGKLAQQIQQGAPVDVFISANEKWMDTLIHDNLVLEHTKQEVTGNTLVLITHQDSPLDYSSFSELQAEETRDVAIGNPASVPAGEYTKSVLSELGLWEEFEPQLIFAQDVRQVLTYVESQNVDIGFVYESDALNSDKVKVLATADETLHQKIMYPGAVVTESAQVEESKAFLEFMLTDEAQEILSTFGFTKK